MTIGAKLRLLMVFLVITLITMAAIAFWTSNRFVTQVNDLVDVQLPGVSNMILADMMHDGIRANVYRAILVAKTGSDEEKKETREEAKEFAENIKNYINNLEKLNIHPTTRAAIAPALPRIEEYVKSAGEIVDIALSGDEEKARANLSTFNDKFEALEKELGTLGDLVREDSAQSAAGAAAINSQSMYLNIVSLVIGIILLIFFAAVVRDQQGQLKNIIDNLIKESNRISSTADNLTQAAQNLSASTEQQSSAFQESAAALEEITATVSTTESNSKQLDSNARVSFESASNGKETIEKMLAAMGDINNSNTAMMRQIEDGNKRIGDIIRVIGDIEEKTKVINDIVFQTKLLSFNASVEAARAGEQGKGFAVVAEEVGNLAEMSGNAAKEISDMLSNSVSTVEVIVNENRTKVESLAYDGKNKVEQGIQIANKCGSALEEIVFQASNINTLISEITTAVKEQSKGISEVSKAMGLLDQSSSQNSVISKENLESSKELQDQVQKLESVIKSLSGMMTSKTAHS
ncbi:hypothetical protein DOM21_12325 [Bacteriovorax stolpii]|uniref:HAMP domain-containing methyl-accepting chemotaxis protein n=1 Tax=Bacteriovorax stolpii TaxID=960 RepID=UPI00115BE59E|nr:methyl-accepting chemotaxis protein [Bacteriovorax stolpii]QDK42216.1 hypothetical protein DOM21_12325 [Bacteriovorax stolpii]